MEPTTVGLSEKGRQNLARLKEAGVFGEGIDAYRFAVALALAHGAIPEVIQSRTIYNVGSLDPDKHLYKVVRSLRDASASEPVYETIERLAEWGVSEMIRRLDSNSLNITDLVREVGRRS